LPQEDRFTLIAPHYDNTAIWFCMVWGSFIEKVAKFDLNFNTSTLKYDITKELVESEITSFDPKVLYAIGHGREDTYQRWINACENDDILAGRICNFLSCLTGKQLGSSAVSKGCLAYIGYNDVFGWVDSQYPPFGRYHWSWMDFNQITTYILRGHSVAEAWDKTYARLMDWIRFWDLVMEDPDIVQVILHDMNALVIHGDGNARIEGKQPSYHEVAVCPLGSDEETEDYIFVHIALVCQVDDCDLTNATINVYDEGLNLVSSATVDTRIGGINYTKVAIPKTSINNLAPSTSFILVADIGGVHGTAVGFLKVSSRLPVLLKGYVWKYYRDESGNIAVEPAVGARVYHMWRKFSATTDNEGKYEVYVPAGTYYTCSSLDGWLGFCQVVSVGPRRTTHLKQRCDGFVIPYPKEGCTQLLFRADVQWLPIWPEEWGEYGVTCFEVPDSKVVLSVDRVNYGHPKNIISPLQWINPSIPFATMIVTDVPQGTHSLRIDHVGYYIISAPERDYHTTTIELLGSFGFYGCALFKSEQTEDICVRVFDAVTLENVNATLELLDQYGNVVATTTTDRFGHAWFTDLPIADYRIRVRVQGYREALTDILEANKIWGAYLALIPEGRLKVKVNSNVQHCLMLDSEIFVSNGEFYPLPGSHLLKVPKLVFKEKKVPPDMFIYEFKQWWDGDTSTSKEVYLDRDLELSNEYRELPRLIVRKVGRGVMDHPEGIYYKELNESVSITAGEGLMYWDVDGEKIYGNSISLLMDKNHVVTAYFALATHRLTVKSEPIDVEFKIDGFSAKTPYSSELEEGTYTISMPSTIMVNGRTFNFDHWENGSTSPTRTINLTSDMTLTAHYASVPTTHFLRIIITPGGTTDPPPSTYVYVEGEVVKVRAIPSLGYKFDYWELDGSVIYENPISITMDKDYVLTARFSAIPFANFMSIIPITAAAIVLEYKGRPSLFR